jgi:hypothetical protein
MRNAYSLGLEICSNKSRNTSIPGRGDESLGHWSAHSGAKINGTHLMKREGDSTLPKRANAVQSLNGIFTWSMVSELG